MKKTQLTMIWFLPVIVIGGLFYPMLGYIVLGMMVFFLTLSFFKARYWCWNLCPRGAFLDIALSKVSRKRPAPRVFAKKWFRWLVFSLLMAFVVFRIIRSGGNEVVIGTIFVSMCIITTIISIVLGIATKHRAWCMICPMGTLQEKIGSRIKLKVILLFLSTVLIMNNSICAEPTVSEKDLLRKELIFSDKEEAYRYLGVTLQKLTEVIKITKAELAKLVKKAENNTNDVTMNDAKPVKVKVDEISKIEVALEKLQEKEEIRRLKSEILKLIREIGEVTELAFPLFGDVMARRETAIESAPKNAIVMPKVVKSHLGDLSDSLLGVERSLVVLQQAI